MDIDTTEFQKKYLNKNFLTLFAIIFIFLYILASFVKFLGQIPILIIITFFICAFLQSRMKKNKDE